MTGQMHGVRGGQRVADALTVGRRTGEQASGTRQADRSDLPGGVDQPRSGDRHHLAVTLPGVIDHGSLVE